MSALDDARAVLGRSSHWEDVVGAGDIRRALAALVAECERFLASDPDSFDRHQLGGLLVRAVEEHNGLYIEGCTGDRKGWFVSAWPSGPRLSRATLPDALRALLAKVEDAP